MKYIPGDTYIYNSYVNGNQRIVIRSDDNAWVMLPVADSVPITDEDMNMHFSVPESINTDRAVFVRHGVDILRDALLGYADNIQF